MQMPCSAGAVSSCKGDSLLIAVPWRRYTYHTPINMCSVGTYGQFKLVFHILFVSFCPQIPNTSADAVSRQRWGKPGCFVFQPTMGNLWNLPLSLFHPRASVVTAGRSPSSFGIPPAAMDIEGRQVYITFGVTRECDAFFPDRCGES